MRSSSICPEVCRAALDGIVNQDVVYFEDVSNDSFQYFCETALKDFRAGAETELNPVHHVPSERSNQARSGSC